MYELGFKDSLAEKVLFYTNANTIEEIIDAIIPDENGLMRHQFISKEAGA